MESRKIMALGKSSLVISLPKKWLEMNSLEKGDKVSVSFQNDRSLTISSVLDTLESQSEVTLSVGENESGNSIIRNVIASYLNGYSMIKLVTRDFFSPEQNSAIGEVVKSLYMRIIKSSANEVHLQTLMDESMASVYSGIERMYIITSSMCQDTLQAMREWDSDLARSVVSLEEDVDQFMYFLLRLLRSSAFSPALANRLDLDMVDTLDCQTIVHRIEHVADHVTNIASSLIQLFEEKLFMPADIFPVLLKSAEISFYLYDEAVQSFLSKDISKTNDIIDKQSEIIELEEEITPLPYHGEKSERRGLCHVGVIRDSVKRISEYAADIAELTIDSSLKA